MGYVVSPPVFVCMFMSGGRLYSNVYEAIMVVSFCMVYHVLSLHTFPVPYLLLESGMFGWKERERVLHDTCCGRAYLHSAQPLLLHQDIKS